MNTLRYPPLLTSTELLGFFIGENKKLEKDILSGKAGIATTDHALYEALGSIHESDQFNWRKMVKLLECVKIVSYENVYHEQKPILTDYTVEQLRKKVIK